MVTTNTPVATRDNRMLMVSSLSNDARAMQQIRASAARLMPSQWTIQAARLNSDNIKLKAHDSIEFSLRWRNVLSPQSDESKRHGKTGPEKVGFLARLINR
jgi:hypothetical protein